MFTKFAITAILKTVNAYRQVLNYYLLIFEYYGTDKEVKQAFDRINLEGIHFTPTFDKRTKTEILEY